eukprot:707779-Pyramimonas_sp.AAC.1
MQCYAYVPHNVDLNKRVLVLSLPTKTVPTPLQRRSGPSYEQRLTCARAKTIGGARWRPST